MIEIVIYHDGTEIGVAEAKEVAESIPYYVPHISDVPIKVVKREALN